jgi:hypothetical protein
VFHGLHSVLLRRVRSVCVSRWVGGIGKLAVCTANCASHGLQWAMRFAVLHFILRTTHLRSRVERLAQMSGQVVQTGAINGDDTELTCALMHVNANRFSADENATSTQAAQGVAEFAQFEQG